MLDGYRSGLGECRKVTGQGRLIVQWYKSVDDVGAMLQVRGD